MDANVILEYLKLAIEDKRGIAIYLPKHRIVLNVIPDDDPPVSAEIRTDGLIHAQSTYSGTIFDPASVISLVWTAYDHPLGEHGNEERPGQYA